MEGGLSLKGRCAEKNLLKDIMLRPEGWVVGVTPGNRDVH